MTYAEFPISWNFAGDHSMACRKIPLSLVFLPCSLSTARQGACNGFEAQWSGPPVRQFNIKQQLKSRWFQRFRWFQRLFSFAMVHPQGLEPWTSAFVVRYSIQLSYGRSNSTAIILVFNSNVKSYCCCIAAVLSFSPYLLIFLCFHIFTV